MINELTLISFQIFHSLFYAWAHVCLGECSMCTLQLLSVVFNKPKCQVGLGKRKFSTDNLLVGFYSVTPECAAYKLADRKELWRAAQDKRFIDHSEQEPGCSWAFAGWRSGTRLGTLCWAGEQWLVKLGLLFLGDPVIET